MATKDLRIGNRLSVAHHRAPYDDFENMYRQITGIVRNPTCRHVPFELLAKLALTLSTIQPYYAGDESAGVTDALVVMGNVDGFERYDRFVPVGYYDGDFIRVMKSMKNVDHSRRPRRPPPAQAIVETGRRLRDMNFLRVLAQDLPTAAIVGGSLSYGRFLNVYGATSNRSGSDIDLILIVEDSEALTNFAKRLTLLHGVDSRSAKSLMRRASKFVTIYSDDDTMMFSHRLAMWTSGMPDDLMQWVPARSSYSISLHVLTLESLDYVLVKSCQVLQKSYAGERRTITDYRERLRRAQIAPERLTVQQRNFAGWTFETPVIETSAELGVMREVPVYYMTPDGFYCPGLTQSILLNPEPPLWDHLGIAERLALFRSKIKAQVEHERRHNPGRDLQPSSSHIRNQYFAPHAREAYDA